MFNHRGDKRTKSNTLQIINIHSGQNISDVTLILPNIVLDISVAGWNYTIYLRRETETGFTTNLKPVSTNGARPYFISDGVFETWIFWCCSSLTLSLYRRMYISSKFFQFPVKLSQFLSAAFLFDVFTFNLLTSNWTAIYAKTDSEQRLCPRWACKCNGQTARGRQNDRRTGRLKKLHISICLMVNWYSFVKSQSNFIISAERRTYWTLPVNWSVQFCVTDTI